MLLDANVLLYSVDEQSPFHHRAVTWLTDALNGPHRVGIPWLSLWAFVRIVSNPRALATPLTGAEAWEHVEDWLGAPATSARLRSEDRAEFSAWQQLLPRLAVPDASAAP